MKRRVTYKRTSQKHLPTAMVVTLMVVVMIIAGVRGMTLHAQLAEYDAQIESLQQQIADEEARTQEIEEYGKYTQTDAYVEEVARDKLGLVKENEIIFRNEDAD